MQQVQRPALVLRLGERWVDPQVAAQGCQHVRWHAPLASEILFQSSLRVLSGDFDLVRLIRFVGDQRQRADRRIAHILELGHQLSAVRQ